MLKDNQVPEAIPDQPASVDDIGLPEGFLHNLALKVLYTQGTMVGGEIADRLALPFGSVLRDLLDQLEDEQYLEVKGGGQFASEWKYQITGEGRTRAREILDEDRYVGPAPVPLEQYDEVTARFAVSDERVSESDLARAFSDLQVPEEYFDVFGPAINSGQSVFVYGEPGNGKTAMCERAVESFQDYVGIPHAVYAGGSVIKVFDAHHHDAQELDEDVSIDRRWNVCKRPFISVGGELTMDELDLIYNPDIGYYEAPFQMKANTGLLLIDDFGRQQMSPGELLNRWIVPLEKRRDFLTLHTGQKINVPFEVLVFYSTNLDPVELVDEAFLRRLRYKIEATNPTAEEYRELFHEACSDAGLQCSEEALDYLLREQYENAGRAMRRCHPRDLIETIQDYCNYHNEDVRIDEETLDRAAQTYFPDNVIQETS